MVPDTFSDPSGNDNLDGGDNRDAIYGESGNDTLIAGRGLGDLLNGGDGDDLLLGSDDSAVPGAGVVYTGDSLIGGSGNDRIFGFGGYDAIEAGDGDDTIDSNTLTGNFYRGIEINSGLTSENSIVGPATGTNTGLFMSGGTARNNVIRQNGIGVEANSATIIDNQIAENRTTGITTQGSVLSGNIIRNNSTGILIAAGSTINNNILDHNSLRGLLHQYTYQTTSTFTNNTIYQPIGSAIELNSSRNNLTLTNNVIWAGGDFAIKDTLDSQDGFNSDYNLFHLAGAVKFSNWQAADIVNLRDWNNRVGEDLHSLQADPMFVDVANSNFALLSTSPAIDTAL